MPYNLSRKMKNAFMWKIVNMFVVFSLVLSYMSPLLQVNIARAEDGAAVSVSDTNTNEEVRESSSTEEEVNGDDPQHLIDSSTGEIKEDIKQDFDVEDTKDVEDSVDQTQSTDAVSEGDTSDQNSEADSSTDDSSDEPEDSSLGEVLGDIFDSVASLFTSDDSYDEDAEITEDVSRCAKTGACGPTQSTPASIRVCKVIVDESGALNPTVPAGTTFAVNNNEDNSDSFGAPAGDMGDFTFTTPLTLNADLFGNDGINDAQCITHDNLLGANPGYHYHEEEIDSSNADWGTPKYNDQYGIPGFVAGSNFNLNKFKLFSDKLFDGDVTNDASRDQRADGHITVKSYPNRTLVVVNTYKGEIEQCEESSQTIVSDTTATVVGGGNAVATFVHGNWTSVPDATWIWDSAFVANPTQNETKTFEKIFNVNGAVTASQLTLAADNSYKVWINGHLIGEDATEFNYGATDTFSSIDPTFFNAGSNTIKMEVTNKGVANSTSTSNPAGALFKLNLRTEDCGGEEIPYCGDGTIDQNLGEECEIGDENCDEFCHLVPQCTDKIMARIVVTNVANLHPNANGAGNVTSDIYVGGSTPAHQYDSGEWFELHDGTNWITDPTNFSLYHDVAGLAVQRMDGVVRIRDIGPFADPINGGLKPQEHIEGYLEIQNASVITQENDLDSGPSTAMDAPSNGTKEIKDTNDELWIDGGKSYFWMTTSTGNDSFYTFISNPTISNCEEEVPYCGDGMVNQESEQCDGGEDCNQQCQFIVTTEPYCGDGTINQESEQCDGGDNCNDSCQIIPDNENPVCTPGVNLIKNAGFEAPLVTANDGTWEIMSTGMLGLEWIAEYLSGNLNPGLELQAGGFWTPHGGSQYAELDGNESTRIYQDIPTVVGATYTLSYWFSPRPQEFVTDNTLVSSVNGTTAVTTSANGSADTDTTWQNITHSFTATSTTTRIAFENTDVSDSHGTFLDDVSVTCDEDGQGGDGDGDGNGDGNGGDNDNGGGGNGGGSSSGSRPRNNDGEVLGASTGPDGIGGGDVLGLAQTGYDFSGVTLFVLLALAVLFISRRREEKSL